MKRRNFLKLALAGGAGAAGYYYWPDEGFFNQCLAGPTPQTLLDHELVQAAWEGIDPQQFWDVHTHLIGTGDGGSGIYIHPHMLQMSHPSKNIRYHFYINAACAESDKGIDMGFIDYLRKLQAEFPGGAKNMLLAFEAYYDEQGRQDLQRTAFYTPHAYAQNLARRYPERFEWIASIHPYREDCVEALDDAVSNGARAVKWLPPVMGIDPASKKCDVFYAALVRHKIPLLTHAGDEHAVDIDNQQQFGNPLRLRRALDQGVKVIVAHCASHGDGDDLDKIKNGRRYTNFELFARMMDEQQYAAQLFGEISAMTQLNRLGKPIETLIKRQDWHHRLLNGSDYPLPAVMPVYSTRSMAKRGYISESQAVVLAQLRQHNALLYDFVLKRSMRVDGQRLSNTIFETRRMFSR